jgi:hypothetical protein
MKNLTLSLFFAVNLLLACNNRNKTSQGTQPATAAEIAEAKSELDKEIEELQQLTPYTIEEMKTFAPEELDGDSATSREAYSNMGTGFAQAVYPLSDSTSLELSLFDCGGVAGAGFYSRQFVDHLGNQSENDNEYTRVIDFKEGKAIEHFNKRKNFSSLTYTAADRLLVILEGKGIEPDELKDKAGELKFK